MIIQAYVTRQKGQWLKDKGFKVALAPHSAVVDIESETATDKQLTNVGMSRKDLIELTRNPIEEQAATIIALEERLNKLDGGA